MQCYISPQVTLFVNIIGIFVGHFSNVVLNQDFLML